MKIKSIEVNMNECCHAESWEIIMHLVAVCDHWVQTKMTSVRNRLYAGTTQSELYVVVYYKILPVYFVPISVNQETENGIMGQLGRSANMESYASYCSCSHDVFCFISQI